MASVFPSGQPRRCGNGHELGPGQVIIGSVPCSCPPAKVINFRRHAWAKCETCGDTIYDPPHGLGAGRLVGATWEYGRPGRRQVFTVGMIVMCGVVVEAAPAARAAGLVGMGYQDAVRRLRSKHPRAIVREID